MASNDRRYPPAECLEWIAGQEGGAVELSQLRDRIATELGRLVAELTAPVCDRSLPEEECRPYLARVWHCFDYHWRRLSTDCTIPFDTMRRRFETSDLGMNTSHANLLREVVLAQALEAKHSKAAEMFERDYVPDVRRAALGCGGQQAVDLVENLSADLILPRTSNGKPLPSRIASYQGRTSLRSWLRAVVANLWISAKRRRTVLGLTGSADVADPRVCEPTSAGSDCEDLLRPTFTSAVEQIESEDRLLLKMLLVDEVPQQALAKSLGIHSGNVTRRRQRAAATMWEFVRSAGIRSRCAQRFEECLHEVLVGEDRRLSQALGAALTQAIESGDSPTRQGAPR